jgi:hypothetical protein
MSVRQLYPYFVAMTRLYNIEHVGVAIENFIRKVLGLNFGRAPSVLSDGSYGLF